MNDDQIIINDVLIIHYIMWQSGGSDSDLKEFKMQSLPSMKKISVSIPCARNRVISVNPRHNSVEQVALHFILWAGNRLWRGLATLDPLSCEQAVVGPGPCSIVPRLFHSTILGEDFLGSLEWGAGVKKMTGREAGMNKL